MANIVKVGMADLNVCKSPDGITTLGLGSCVGICIRDPIAKNRWYGACNAAGQYTNRE